MMDLALIPCLVCCGYVRLLFQTSSLPSSLNVKISATISPARASIPKIAKSMEGQGFYALSCLLGVALGGILKDYPWFE